MAGRIVPTGFATGSPGTFALRLHHRYPEAAAVAAAEFAVRLGLRCDGNVVFRDLYDLIDWTEEVPSNLGDDQVVDVYFNELDEFPVLAHEGIPLLCAKS